MNIHKIDSHLHQSFLEEKRKDAITGDLIKANDEVVFCGICKSAFLKDSWEYMDRKHCGQTKTLKKVPISVPLLLNVSRIVPHFITLVNTSISFEKCLKILSSFNPRDKKVEIRLDPILKHGTEQYESLFKKINEPIEKEVQKTDTEQSSDGDIVTFITITMIVSFILGLFTLPFLETVLSKFIFFSSMALLSYIFVFGNTKYSLKKSVKKEKYQFPIRNIDASETKTSVTFGIFNHSLFFYFEQAQQGIFIELARISEIEIQYQSSCCVNLVLRKNDKNNNEITIPLIFSKKERITTFLIRLAKTKKGISNHSQIKLTNFPIDRIRFLKRKLILYTDILFIEHEKVESKKEFTFIKNDSISAEKIIQPKDLNKLRKSQKVSKQSQNRNQHHQNQHQTQYRNYKRR
ncbi:hypothetical protein Fleli_0215 [Bernardetia litoralis DSM 6794]|uniref:Uncharacterized protein n=1 Tax=Bernardetia litoralis (strain ATCC 23117 / DSM 6794 / NBRC 15988 / NCIMB 1366 / Fx l1 / Sio-4) TaxID=880071 RepID=I4AFH5_BERLS|nr:hypothetical protein [Bernardetia litoralis]AFM02710.1 hypothetical protein Fleli_0215 [Bernardetia litoralis DSM 6794]